MAEGSIEDQLVTRFGLEGDLAHEDGAAVLLPARSNLSLAWYRFRRHRMALVGSALLLIILVGCLIVPFFFPPDAANTTSFDIQQAPSPAHLLGTDEDGRDIAMRLLAAGRVSLAVGFVAMSAAAVFGTLLGVLAGFYGRWIDVAVMRATDVLLGIPTIYMLIVLAVLLGPSFTSMIIAIGLLSWMELARIVRASTLSLREKEFVDAARALGVSNATIMRRHILPSMLGAIVVAGTLGIANAVVLETTVSFFGLGIQPPTASWGNMLSNSQIEMWTAPWLAIFPGMMILLTLLSINFLGDGLRDALDPHH
jgi:peptide/nickel transport system permease protein